MAYTCIGLNTIRVYEYNYIARSAHTFMTVSYNQNSRFTACCIRAYTRANRCICLSVCIRIMDDVCQSVSRIQWLLTLLTVCCRLQIRWLQICRFNFQNNNKCDLFWVVLRINALVGGVCVGLSLCVSGINTDSEAGCCWRRTKGN